CPVLRPNDRFACRWPVGLAHPRDRRRMGTCRGHAMIVKRPLDLLIGVVGAIVSAPFVGLLALAVRLESPGHPIYTQTRVGRDGQPFTIYKLRTMVAGAEFTGAGLAINQGDDRITRVGAFLRRTSLDELPHPWNVLRGDM